jgi:hypothetical protein
MEIIEHPQLITSSQQVGLGGEMTFQRCSMLSTSSAYLAFCAAVDVQGTLRIWQHFIPKDSVKWSGPVVELMLKAYAIFLVERRRSSLSAFAMQSSSPSSGALAGGGTFEESFLPDFTSLIQ